MKMVTISALVGKHQTFEQQASEDRFVVLVGIGLASGLHAGKAR